MRRVGAKDVFIYLTSNYYTPAITTPSGTLTLHKARIFLKNLLKKKKIFNFKNNIQTEL